MFNIFQWFDDIFEFVIQIIWEAFSDKLDLTNFWAGATGAMNNWTETRYIRNLGADYN